MASKKIRIDTLLVERGLATSRTQAQALVMAGKVFSGTQRIDKSSQLALPSIELTVESAPRFVSRGGDKLVGALEDFAKFGLNVRDLICADIGASTGGFTDCLLQYGAQHVFAIDVGYGQLASKLQNDPRVTVMDRVNARYLKSSDLPTLVQLVVVDASFISLKLLFSAIQQILSKEGHLIALMKPQFEAGRDATKRNHGVIRDEQLRIHTFGEIVEQLPHYGFSYVSEIDSAVHGPQGNIERFLLAKKTSNNLGYSQ